MSEHIIIVIPARWGSTRFPGKPLADIAGKSMIERVHARCAASARASRVIVATDDERIRSEVARFGGEAVMTPADLPSGTERMAWVARETEADIYVNVQGDEPLLPPATIDAAVDALIRNPEADIATACCPLTGDADIANPNIVKLVTDRAGFALYFSRAPIPHVRDSAGIETPSGGTAEDASGSGDTADGDGRSADGDGNAFARTGVYKKHIGIYVFRRNALLRFAALDPTPLERLEKLEQLRALEHGMRIVVAEVETDSQAVDTPGDIEKVERLIHDDKMEI